MLDHSRLMSTAAVASPLSPHTTMADLQAAIPGARRALFARYHIGGCQSCGFRDDETLADVCARNDNLPVNEVISHIEASHENDLRLQISPAELAEILASSTDGGASVRLLDVRTQEEREAVALPGATAMSQELLREAFATWDKSAPVFIYDHTGPQALDTAAYFAGHGFTNVKALAGGIDRYSQDVDPTLPRYRVEW